MKEKTRRALVCAALIGMLVMDVLPLAGASDARDGDKEITFWPLAEAGPWTDTLDDLSHVYVPSGGLVGVEVSGGNAHLKQGQAEGWIASSVITCPVDHRYDLVYLEAEVPGESSIDISILNASAEATEIGFANDTIPDLKRLEGTDLSVYSLNPAAYPALRIQVNLRADGTQMPRLLSWSLHYTGLETWYDDFLGDAKMSSHRGINLTGGSLEVDLTRRGASSGGGYYDSFPPIVVTRYGQTNENKANILKPNAARTDYLQVVNMEGRGTTGMIFDDINLDGHLDLVLANYWYDDASTDSEVLWGDGTGSWSRTGATGVTTPMAYKVSTGDLNGDGWPDIVFAADGSNGEKSKAFFNKGSGDFNQFSDHEFNMPDARNVDIGDVNGDGLADVAFVSQSGYFHLYYSSVGGLEEDPDVSYDVGSAFDVRIGDLDRDGFGDVIVGCTGVGDEAFSVFFGSDVGIHNLPDLNLSYYNGYVDACDFGDINGDGYNDIVVTTAKNGVYKLFIFPGSPTGWDEDERHSIDTSNWPYGCKVVDLDKDGYDDIAFSQSDAIKVFRGGDLPDHRVPHASRRLLPTGPRRGGTTGGLRAGGVQR